jgi:hypothetical protein
MQGREGGAEAKKVGVVAHPRQRALHIPAPIVGQLGNVVLHPEPSTLATNQGLFL